MTGVVFQCKNYFRMQYFLYIIYSIKMLDYN